MYGFNVSRPFRIVSGVTLNANIKIEGMGGGDTA